MCNRRECLFIINTGLLQVPLGYKATKLCKDPSALAIFGFENPATFNSFTHSGKLFKFHFSYEMQSHCPWLASIQPLQLSSVLPQQWQVLLEFDQSKYTNLIHIPTSFQWLFQLSLVVSWLEVNGEVEGDFLPLYHLYPHQPLSPDQLKMEWPQHQNFFQRNLVWLRLLTSFSMKKYLWTPVQSLTLHFTVYIPCD